MSQFGNALDPAPTAETWRFTKDGRSATVRPSGPLRVNNGDAMMPALIAGSGLGILPEFILRDALATGLLERLLPDWSIPLGAVYWLTPPAGPRPKRVEILGNFLIEKLAGHAKRGARAAPASTLRPAGKAKRRWAASYFCQMSLVIVLNLPLLAGCFGLVGEFRPCVRLATEPASFRPSGRNGVQLALRHRFMAASHTSKDRLCASASFFSLKTEARIRRCRHSR